MSSALHCGIRYSKQYTVHFGSCTIVGLLGILCIKNILCFSKYTYCWLQCFFFFFTVNMGCYVCVLFSLVICCSSPAEKHCHVLHCPDWEDYRPILSRDALSVSDSVWIRLVWFDSHIHSLIWSLIFFIVFFPVSLFLLCCDCESSDYSWIMITISFDSYLISLILDSNLM